MGYLQIFFLFSLALAGGLHHLLTVQFMAKSANFPVQVNFFYQSPDYNFNSS